MKSLAALAVIAALMQTASAYGTQERKLGAAPEFKINFPISGVASCYGSEYTYYKSWACGATPCSDGESSKCPGTDPQDTSEADAAAATMATITMVVPIVVGSIALICCLCCCCGIYYASQYAIEWRAKQARMKPKNQPTKGAERKGDGESSESDFDRS